MKKITIYISIIIVLIGLWSPTVLVNAQSAPNGTCVTDKSTYNNITKASCDLVAKNTGEKVISWTPNSGAPGTPMAPSYPTPNQTTTYGLLSPLPNLTQFNSAEPNALGRYLNTMITIIIGLAAVMAVVMIVMGGIEYMTSELVHSKEAGKEKITGAILGLLIALGAYALLYTINPDLLNTDLGSVGSVTVTVDLEVDTPQTPVNGKYPNGTSFGAKWDDTVGKIAGLPANVTVANAQCTTVGQRNCTSTRNLNVSTVQAIQSGCKCALVITGATESWLHGGRSGSTSHQLGGSTVDLRRTPELDKYLSGGQSLVPMRRYPATGGPYLYEGNHWHIGR